MVTTKKYHTHTNYTHKTGEKRNRMIHYKNSTKYEEGSNEEDEGQLILIHKIYRKQIAKWQK